MIRHRRFPVLVAAAAAVLWAGIAAAYGVWNLREGSYFEELQDTVDLSLIQAVSVDQGKTTIGVTSAWTWVQPGPSATYLTDTLFSIAGSATTFVTIVTATGYGEAMQLYTRFYSAVNDMNWDNDCPSLHQTDPNCLVYPIPAAGVERLLGARSNLVLLVPDVERFFSCQTATMGCAGSKDNTFASLYIQQDLNRDLFISGLPYNVTWWLRSPGIGPNPPGGAEGYNDRLAGFEISYTYTTNGTLATDYLGGATAGCQDLGTDTCAKRNRGCPVRLRVADPFEAGSATLYMNTPGNPNKSPYTPISFSFVLGAGPDIFHPNDCVADLLGGMNIALCHTPPQGTWGFFIGTRGSGAKCAGEKCPATGTSIPCCSPRASASLYIDGLTITAGAGIYLSPAFDSLSPNTLWSTVAWRLDLNADAKGVRTPVDFDWRVSNSTAGFLFSSTTFDAGITPLTEESAAPIPGAVKGRYFQYRALLSSWDQNVDNPPPPPSGPDVCLRYSMQYDGSLQPRVRQFAVAYLADAGQFVSKPVQPAKLWRWDKVTYRKDDGLGGSVVCDVLDADGTTILSNIASGDSLAGIDPGRHPGIRVRFTLNRNGVGASPYVDWFRVSYSPLKGCLALDHNAIRLSYDEGVAVRFCTARTGMVEVLIHDAAGQLVKRIFHGELKTGEICQKSWNGTSDPGGRAPASCAVNDTNVQGNPVAPGLYFVTVTTPAGRETALLAVSR